MTDAELRQLFPNRSESFYAANASDLPKVQKQVATLAPTPRKPATTAKRARAKASRVPLTRNSGTWSEAKYWQAVRSALRRGFRFWKPINQALLAARVHAPGPRGRKWLFLCASCTKLHLRRDVHVDHVVPCGELREPAHIAPFLARLTVEDVSGYQVLCKTCHQAKTNRESSSSES